METLQKALLQTGILQAFAGAGLTLFVLMRLSSSNLDDVFRVYGGATIFSAVFLGILGYRLGQQWIEGLAPPK